MRALIVQHEHDGPVAGFGEHLAARGIELVVHQVLEPGSSESHHAFPDATDFDLVVPLGSVHGVYEHDVIGTWIHREVEMLRAAHDAGVPIFGICFGAQALTMVLGGSVAPSPTYEIGWKSYDSDLPQSIAPGPWFTWHGDRCALPDGVDELARNELCPQAFRSGRSVGVQFHPEATRELVATWASKLPPDYFAGKGTSAAELLAGFDTHPGLSAQTATLFDWFLDDVAS
jgi:GMP synthase-like glutamine amidotransferase